MNKVKNPSKENKKYIKSIYKKENAASMIFDGNIYFSQSGAGYTDNAVNQAYIGEYQLVGLKKIVYLQSKILVMESQENMTQKLNFLNLSQAINLKILMNLFQLLF